MKTTTSAGRGGALRTVVAEMKCGAGMKRIADRCYVAYADVCDWADRIEEALEANNDFAPPRGTGTAKQKPIRKRRVRNTHLGAPGMARRKDA